jgi:hypothetical protein
VWLTTLQRGVGDGDFHAGLDVRLVYWFIGAVLFMTARRCSPGRSEAHAPAAEIAGIYRRSLMLSGLLP